MTRTKTVFVQLMLALLLSGMATHAWSASYSVGGKKCKKCHESEFKVWKKSKHFHSYKSVHKKKSAKKIIKAVGGKKSMKKNKTCISCHYTLVKKSATKKARVKAGPSCESCHGPASGWINVHNNYGGKGIKANNEPPAHKAERIKKASAAGMIWSSMSYDIAANCMNCHGLASAKIKGSVLAKMLDAGHPIEADFELVKYSMGTIRHRFYPPKTNVNSEMSAAELARFFIAGQAAKLVMATVVATKSKHPKFKAAQQKRIQDARAALQGVAGMPTVKALLKQPSEANARKVIAAIAAKKLSAKVGSMLPPKSSYK